MRKIIFHDKYDLTQAVLEGRKTMSRRLCKGYKTGKIILAEDVDSCIFCQDENRVEFVMKNGEIVVYVPPYRIGEIIAIAQRYSDIYNEFSWLNLTKGWNNKMFVKAFYMTNQIRITDIKFEKLQDISDEDCLKEGIFKSSWNRYYQYTFRHSSKNYHTPREAFAALIDKVSGNGTWDSNPLVFVYEFELVK